MSNKKTNQPNQKNKQRKKTKKNKEATLYKKIGNSRSPAPGGCYVKYDTDEYRLRLGLVKPSQHVDQKLRSTA